MANDPAFVRSATAEAEAMKNLGLTKAEIDARGGVNAAGYYGDSWSSSTKLTDTEYAAALAKGGGAEVNAATQAKVDAYKKANNIVDPKKQLEQDAIDLARKDAFALLADTFKQYGLGSLAETIKGYMTSNVGPEEAKVLLKQTEAYKARFAGNIARVAAGKNAIDEGTYLALENQYAEVLKAYGQESLGSQAEYADLIKNDISNIELGDRLKLAVTRVQQSDPGIKAQLKAFYPGITDADLVKYFLKPDQTLPELERKVTASEIGAAAAAQGFDKGTTAEQITGYKTKAEALAAYGITRDQAITGYQNIAKVLPESQKLSKIYGEAQIDYTQATGEEEFLKDNVAASRKRKQLEELERAKFSGSSGMSTQYTSLGKSTQGKF